MDARAVIKFAMGMPEAREDHPFGPDPDVYKVDGRIFAIVRPDAEPPVVSLKCEPGLALELRDRYEAVTPGWHLNKRHWNTVTLDGSVPAAEVRKMIRHSYEQVVKKLPREARDRLLKK